MNQAIIMHNLAGESLPPGPSPKNTVSDTPPSAGDTPATPPKKMTKKFRGSSARSLTEKNENLNRSMPNAGKLKTLQKKHHGRCLFLKGTLIPNLDFHFVNDCLLLHHSFNTLYEGYDGMVHGGILAAIIDASMTQCLMGHGITGYTGELTIRYRGPVKLNARTTMVTRLISGRFDKLYTMETAVSQEQKTCVTATSKFLKITQ
jgi:hypothetical protein